MICTKCGNSHHDLRAERCRVCGVALAEAGAAPSRAHARSASGWRDAGNWRRHLFQRLGATPVEVREGRPFVLGRSSKCDLSIKSGQISRRHAEVAWSGRDPILRDLGSENGTQVNGKPIREHPLKDGDQVSLGPFTCTYRCLNLRGSLRRAQEDLEDSQSDTQTLQAVALSGTIEAMGLYEVLETLSYNQKSGTLEVFAPWGGDARVTLLEGVALHAVVGQLTGEDAIFGLLRWEEGSYRFVNGVDPDLVPNVRPTTQAILHEARRRMHHGLTEGDYQDRGEGALDP